MSARKRTRGHQVFEKRSSRISPNSWHRRARFLARQPKYPREDHQPSWVVAPSGGPSLRGHAPWPTLWAVRAWSLGHVVFGGARCKAGAVITSATGDRLRNRSRTTIGRLGRRDRRGVAPTWASDRAVSDLGRSRSAESTTEPLGGLSHGPSAVADPRPDAGDLGIAREPSGILLGRLSMPRADRDDTFRIETSGDQHRLLDRAGHQPIAERRTARRSPPRHGRSRPAPDRTPPTTS